MALLPVFTPSTLIPVLWDVQLAFVTVLPSTQLQVIFGLPSSPHHAGGTDAWQLDSCHAAQCMEIIAAQSHLLRLHPVAGNYQLAGDRHGSCRPAADLPTGVTSGLPLCHAFVLLR